MKQSNMMTSPIMALLIAGAGTLALSTQTSATASAPQMLCESYPNAQLCNQRPNDCSTCHQATPPALNPFGTDLVRALDGRELTASIADALASIADKDSDSDKFTNADEINLATNPGQATDFPKGEAAPVEYDYLLAFRRVHVVYCGRQASFAEITAFDGSPDQKTHLHSALDSCLKSDYWKNEALPRLADAKIRPILAVGKEGNVVIGDYKWDYRLFSYTMTGDRDVRELLSATYHIDINGNKVEGVIAREEPLAVGTRIVIAGGQPLVPDKRAGMLTTQWFLSANTMFAQVPRNTAAQAVRAYLGQDLALAQGLMPIAGEPRDVDNKNVAAPECAVCHSTLDPLAYSFASYNGIETTPQVILRNGIGTYDENRTPWGADGHILATPVVDLQAWVKVALQSDLFQKKVAGDLFMQALDRSPRISEIKEFDSLWVSMPVDGYSANRLIHRLIDTQAFGGRP